MTDLTPSDLSHLSEDEFNALCPQGEHAPGPPPLSPAAQAVLDAYEKANDCYREEWGQLAAALRAAADQVVPPTTQCHVANLKIRHYLLAIAAELEGAR